MISPYQVVQFRLSNIILSVVATLALIGTFWLTFVGLTCAGCPFPQIPIEKFYDLGFFSFSTFSFIIFLTMIPFQTAEGKLSPGFYARTLRNPWSHFGPYLLLTCSIICFLVIALYQTSSDGKYLNQLFMSLVASIITAILFYRVFVLRYLHEPYSVYVNVDKLMKEETREEVWMEILECTYKAVRDARLSDSKNFLNLLMKLYNLNSETERKNVLQEDLKSLYKASGDLRPVSRYMEMKWPFLRSSDKTQAVEYITEEQ